MSAAPGQPRWNGNLHYHQLILEAIPASARTALDIGTGDGLLATDLRCQVPTVVGIDSDAPVLERARAEDASVEWVLGDVMAHPFAPASFDVVASVATLHHLPDMEAALRRFVDLTAPGGTVAIIGLARSSRLRDVLADIAGTAQHQALRRTRNYWEHTAPVAWPPPHTYGEVRRAAEQIMPGVRWRRLPLFRYALLWTKPGEADQN